MYICFSCPYRSVRYYKIYCSFAPQFPRRLGSRGQSRYHYDGLRVKQTSALAKLPDVARKIKIDADKIEFHNIGPEKLELLLVSRLECLGIRRYLWSISVDLLMKAFEEEITLLTLSLYLNILFVVVWSTTDIMLRALMTKALDPPVLLLSIWYVVFAEFLLYIYIYEREGGREK